MRTPFVACMLIGLLLLPMAGCAQADSDPAQGDGLHASVPNVIGMTVDDATEELESAGYEVGQVRPEGADGEVLEQEPPAGYSAPRGAEVDLVTSQ